MVAHPAPGPQNPDQSPSMEERLALLEQLLTRQQERIAQQDEEIGAQRAEMAHLRAAIVDTHAEPALILPASMHDIADDDKPSRRSSRRNLLKLGGAAAAAGVAGALLSEQSGTALAAPQHYNSLPHEGDASGLGATGIFGDGINGAGGVVGKSDKSIGVNGISDSSTGVNGQSGSGVGVWGASTFSTGVNGVSDAGVGVWGQSTDSDGVHAVALGSFSGVAGISTSGVGGYFNGGRAPVNLQPASGPGAPTSGGHTSKATSTSTALPRCGSVRRMAFRAPGHGWGRSRQDTPAARPPT